MNLSDGDLSNYVSNKLALPGDKRNEFRKQVGRLLDKLQSKLDEDGSYKMQKFRRAGSLEKGTSNRARSGKAVDADVGVYFELDDPEEFDIADLQKRIKELLIAAYPQKDPEDFDDSPSRTFGVVFKGTELEIDLVPIVSLDDDANYGYQYSKSGDKVKTSVKAHLEFYREHAKTDPLLATLLRLVKRWVYWQELHGINSFHCELILCYLIDQKGPAASIEDGLRRFFLYVGRGLGETITFSETEVAEFNSSVVIVDPANDENNVASRIEGQEKEDWVSRSLTAYETIIWAQGLPGKGETLDKWKELFGNNFSIDGP